MVYLYGILYLKERNMPRVVRNIYICDECGNECVGQPDRHHINLNHFDNRAENIKYLCKPCHGIEHTGDYTLHTIDTFDLINRKGSEWYRLAWGYNLIRDDEEAYYPEGITI